METVLLCVACPYMHEKWNTNQVDRGIKIVFLRNCLLGISVGKILQQNVSPSLKYKQYLHLSIFFWQHFAQLPIKIAFRNPAFLFKKKISVFFFFFKRSPNFFKHFFSSVLRRILIMQNIRPNHTHMYLSEIRISRHCGKRNGVSLVVVIHFRRVVWTGPSAVVSPRYKSDINPGQKVGAFNLHRQEDFLFSNDYLPLDLTF